MTPEEKETFEATLDQFCGTNEYHKWSVLFNRHVLTDGVKYLCEKANCYWLVDIIGSYHCECMRDAMLKNMQFWTLTVHPKTTSPMATVICERDSDDVAFRQNIENTDFPLSEIKLWVERADKDLWVIMLPSER